MAVEGSGRASWRTRRGRCGWRASSTTTSKLPGRVVGNLTGTWTDGDTERTAVLATLH